VQALQPCSVADVRFATRYILSISRIDQDHLKAVSFKHFIGRNPVNTGRFHRDSRDAMCLEPSGHIMKIAGECAKRSYRIIIGVRIYGRHMHGRPDVDGGSAWIDHRQRAGF
jgi:hypothetical protein